MPEVTRVFGYWEDSDLKSPFSFNGCVFFNQTIWNNIGFTTEELEAMLAHEIGHAVDTLERTDKSQPESENNADDFAFAHNLGNSLCSALKKCISSGLFSDQEVEGMMKRVYRIHHKSLIQGSNLLRGIYSEPKNKWLIAVDNHWDEIQKHLYMPIEFEFLRVLRAK